MGQPRRRVPRPHSHQDLPVSLLHLARVGLLALFLAGGVATEFQQASAAPVGGCKATSKAKYNSGKPGKSPKGWKSNKSHCKNHKSHGFKGKGSKGKPHAPHCGGKPTSDPTGVPEIDANLFGAGALLLIGGSLVMVGRRRESFGLI
jgi:hypothetical protein